MEPGGMDHTGSPISPERNELLIHGCLAAKFRNPTGPGRLSTCGSGREAVWLPLHGRQTPIGGVEAARDHGPTGRGGVCGGGGP